MAVPQRVISARENRLGFVAGSHGARDGSVLPGTRRAVAFEPVSWSRVSVKPKGLTRTNMLDFECLLYDRAKLGPEKLTWFGKFKYTTAVRHHNIV